jgi:ketol-acid reductoisomerase
VCKTKILMRSFLRSQALRASKRCYFIPAVKSVVKTPFALTRNVRSMKSLTFGSQTEVVFERSDFPREKLAKIFEKDTMAVIGYGSQGRAQSLNMKDNGLKVIVGLRKGGVSWKMAEKDGWVEGQTLFSIEDACDKGTVNF